MLTRSASLALLVLAFAGCRSDEPPPLDLAEAGALAAAQEDAPDTLRVDPASSEIRWSGLYAAGEQGGGFRTFDGGVVLANDSVVSHLRLRLDARSLWSDAPADAVRLADTAHFSAERFPVVTLDATGFTPIDTLSATHRVSGTLTMRGVTRPLTFPASIRITLGTVAVNATFNITPAEWGVGRPGELLADSLRLRINLVVRPSDEEGPNTSRSAGGAAPSDTSIGPGSSSGVTSGTPGAPATTRMDRRALEPRQ